MNNSNPVKKLLILGGKPLCSCEIVEAAKALGYYTIVADYLPIEQSPAKLLANESWDISTADIDNLCDRIKRSKIDGIFTGIHEFNIQSCLSICKRLGLPFYSTQKQWDNFSNKELFRNLCKKYSVPSPERYDLSSESQQNIKYPIIIKPVDGSASRGITVCNNAAHLDDSISFALNFSESKQIIAEQYISGPEVMIYYYIHNGEVYFTGMCDRFVSKHTQQSLQLPNGYCFPSRYADTYLKEVNGYVQNMLKGENCQNGVFSLQAIIKDNKFYIYEACYRLCGTQYHKFLASEYGFDELSELLYYSINGRPVIRTNAELCPRKLNKLFFCLPIHITKGCIAQVTGLDELANIANIIDVVYLHKIGEQMNYDSHFTQIFCRIYLTAANKTELIHTISRIQKQIHIYDENNSEMVILQFDTSLLDEEWPS